jgi:hypothetical protein
MLQTLSSRSRPWVVVLLAICTLQCKAQDSSAVLLNKRCVRNTSMAVAAGIGGTFVALDQAWYAGYDRGPFHSFDDSGEWLQMDKVGHTFSGYQLGRIGYTLYNRCGTKRKTAVWAGGSLGFLFLTGVEVLDGTSDAWGFSWSDMAANAVGTGLFISQELLWDEQRIGVKLSAHTTGFAAQRPDLLGESLPERILKDYNGQTIWLSANLKSFLPNTRIPGWLNIAGGYGGENMISAFPITPLVVGAEYNRYRQYYLSPDIDFTRIRTKSKLLRTVFFVLNGIKFPLPAVEFQSTGKVVGHWIYF